MHWYLARSVPGRGIDRATVIPEPAVQGVLATICGGRGRCGRCSAAIDPRPLNGHPADFSDTPTAISASLQSGSASGEGDDKLVEVENLTGSGANDALTGSDGNNTLKGGMGDDAVTGAGGVDRLLGEGGSDTLDSMDGIDANDSVDGGGGTDTCVTDATENSVLRCEK